MTSSWSPYLHENDTRQDEEEGQSDIHRRPPHPKERVRSKMFTDKLRRISPVHLCKMKVFFLGLGLEFPSSLMYKAFLSLLSWIQLLTVKLLILNTHTHLSEYQVIFLFVFHFYLVTHYFIYIFLFFSFYLFFYLCIYFLFFLGGSKI